MTFFGIGFDSISSFDGKHVVIIHTNAGFLGIQESRGHVDFFPNGKSSLIFSNLSHFTQHNFQQVDNINRAVKMTLFRMFAIIVALGKCFKRAFETEIVLLHRNVNRLKILKMAHVTTTIKLIWAMVQMRKYKENFTFELIVICIECRLVCRAYNFKKQKSVLDLTQPAKLKMNLLIEHKRFLK